ncbi:MAG TPA: LamG-like jellyroll fold domain-containing protein [Candidatus Paceibacterota bacterium]|nr:LamG-like jellyroll fold domain-containing protein [Candidatus Paceibacterota bacterium]
MRYRSRLAFTLIELLIVIAVIAILSIVVVLILNPAQILMQNRDSNRLSDMNTLSTAIGLYQAQGGNSLGTANLVYVSIPDPLATSTLGDQCQGLGLPALPATYAYHCAASSSYRNVNGAGWIPINFTTLAAKAPFSALPVDPINQSSSRLYYAYTTNGTQYEVTSVMESQKYALGGSNDAVASDGGTLASVYEKGSQLGLEPLDYGDPSLLGYWTLNEGGGQVAYDDSGTNATGSWIGNQIGGPTGYYTSNSAVGQYAGDFDGTSDYITTNFDMGGQSAITVCAWVDMNTVVSQELIADQWGGSPQAWMMQVGVTYLTFETNSTLLTTPTPSAGAWHFFAGTYDGSDLVLYVDGQPVNSTAATGAITSGAPKFRIGARANDAQLKFGGIIDDVRVYDRALTAAQIAALYNGHK